MRKILSLVALIAVFPTSLLAQEAEAATSLPPLSFLAAALAISIAALGCGLGQGKAVGAALEAMGRNPSAAGKIQIAMIIGLVFIELMVILSFVIAMALVGKI